MALPVHHKHTTLFVEPGSSPHTFDTNSETYEFIYETLSKRGRILQGTAMRGSRSATSERTRTGAAPVFGRLCMFVSPVILDLWLPRILGAAESSDTFNLAETLPYFGVLIDKDTDTFEYKDGMVDKALFHGHKQEDGPDLITLAMDLIFFDRARATAVPSVSLSTAAGNRVYVHTDAAFTFGGTANREVNEWWTLIDNHVRTRWTNSLTNIKSMAADRTVAVSARLPFDTDTDDLLDQAKAGSSATIALTNNAVPTISTTFSFATLQVPPIDPVVKDRNGNPLLLQMVARKVGATAELTVTNDSTAA